MVIEERHASVLLGRIFEDQLDFDRVWLISYDHQRFPIHRVILCAASKYFTASSLWNSAEGKRDEFPFKDVDGITLKAIVDYCYTGRIDLTEENVKKFLTIASSVELDLLEEKCCRFYFENLSHKNAIEAFIIADTYSYADLRQLALEFVCANFTEISTARTRELSYQLLRELLKSEDLNASEEVIFDYLLEWSQVEEKEREQHMPELLKLVRLEYIPAETLSTLDKFNGANLAMAEYKKRILDPEHFLEKRRRRIRNLIIVVESRGYDTSPSIKIGEYSSSSQKYKRIHEIPNVGRVLFNVVVKRHKVYVIQGDRRMNSMSAYDLSTRQEEVFQPMIAARWNFTSILYQEWIYLFGGNGGNGGALSSCERFNTETNSWASITSMKTKRERPSAVVMNGRIYVAGGHVSGKEKRSVESYDPESDSWTQLASMNIARCNFALIRSKGFLYAFGRSNVGEKYDPLNNRWTEIGAFDEFGGIVNGINVDGELFAIKRNGVYGRIQIDGNGQCSFFTLGDTCRRNEYLVHDWSYLFPK